MARVVLPQSKIKARRKRRRIILASVVVALLVLFFCGLVWLAHASFMRVNSIEVTGTHSLAPADVTNAALADMAGSYLYLFPKNNIFLYPKSKLEADLPKNIPTIAAVSIHAKNFHAVQINVTERTRKALWCGTTTADPSACLWLDENGAAYARVSDIDLSLENASSSYEHYFGALAGNALPEQYVTPEQFHALSALVDALSAQQQNNPLQSIAANADATVQITFANNFQLLFSLSSAGADVYQRFVLALKSDVFAEHQLSDFAYLDLRFGDKLYYKLKSGRVASSTASH